MKPLKVTATLLASSSELPADVVQTVFDALPEVPPEGLPLFYTIGEKEIGKITNFTVVNYKDNAFIVVDATITDSELLGQPWLKYESIVLAAVRFAYQRGVA